MIGVNRNVDKLLWAIGEHEGWFPPDKGMPKGGSRAYRNHNPGNLRKSPFSCGEEQGFAIFRNDLVGWNALQWDLMQKAKGNTSTGLNENSTLRDLIFVYAPPSDNNDSEAYLKDVLDKTGFNETITLGQIFAI